MLKIFGLAGALAISSSLMAVPTLRITQLVGGSGTTTVSGPASFSGTVGTFTIVNSFGSVSGPISVPRLLLQDTTTVTTAGGVIQLAFSEINFTNSLASAIGSLKGTLSSSLGAGSVVYDVFVDSGNVLFGGLGAAGTGFLTTSTSVLSGGSNGAGPVTGAGIPLGSYSLTIVATITQGANTELQSQANYAQVPEPGFYGALGVGLSGLLFFVRRKRSGSLS